MTSCNSIPERLLPKELPKLERYEQEDSYRESFGSSSGHGGPSMEIMNNPTPIKDSPAATKKPRILKGTSFPLQPSPSKGQMPSLGNKYPSLQENKNNQYVVDRSRSLSFKTYPWYGLEGKLVKVIEKDKYKVEVRDPFEFGSYSTVRDGEFDEEYQREMLSRTINTAGRLLKDLIYENADCIPGATTVIYAEKKTKSVLNYFNPLFLFQGSSSVNLDIRTIDHFAIEFGKGSAFIKIGTHPIEGEGILFGFKH